MNAVVEHGTPLVDNPARVGRVRQLGVDETSFLRANRHHHTIYATGLVDLERRRVIDMVEGKRLVIVEAVQQGMLNVVQTPRTSTHPDRHFTCKLRFNQTPLRALAMSPRLVWLSRGTAGEIVPANSVAE